MTLENSPGLYGTEDGVFAHNLLTANATLTPLARPDLSVPVVNERYALDNSRDMKGPLLLAALALLAADGLIVLWLAGVFHRWRRALGGATAAAIALMAILSVLAFAPDAKAAISSRAMRRRSTRYPSRGWLM